MGHPMLPADEQFPDAGTHWDLDALYTDLASARGKGPTPEIVQRCGDVSC
ncbi:hypothetical protein [Laspinema palackyanum]|nr:hypothetical protein [Laspinema sp. D2c]